MSHPSRVTLLESLAALSPDQWLAVVRFCAESLTEQDPGLLMTIAVQEALRRGEQQLKNGERQPLAFEVVLQHVFEDLSLALFVSS